MTRPCCPITLGSGHAGGVTRAVGQKLPNAWGVYDLYGNVAEMCADGTTLRGGYYDAVAAQCTSTAAGSIFDTPANAAGLRLCARLPLLTVNGGHGRRQFPAGRDQHGHGDRARAPHLPRLAGRSTRSHQPIPQRRFGHQCLARAGHAALRHNADRALRTGALSADCGERQRQRQLHQRQSVSITANPTNTLLFEFDRWTGDTYALADPESATTTATIPGAG
jgi:hypothetical protein